VYRNACFQPPADGRAAPGDKFRPRRGDPLDFSAVHCPVAERVCREVCWLTHAMLLADEDVIRAAARAIAKVVENAHELTRPKLELHAKSRKRAPATAAKRG
jgi:hypothetical protein